MTEPQPIKTAPMNRTPIIGMCIKHYPSGEAYWEAASMMYEGGILKDGWAYTGIMVVLVEDEYIPTHWMSLPNPPEPPP